MGKELINYMEQNLKQGERYYFQMEDSSEVEEFYSFLETLSISETFLFHHERGGEYLSYFLKVGDKKLLVAGTVGEITSDFLVTIRNAVAENISQMEGMSVLFLIHTPLDSLTGGGSNLRNQGMPLNINTLYSRILKDIKNSSLSKNQKEIVAFYLDRRLNGIYDTPTLGDFQEVLEILEEGEILPHLYPQLEIFPDETLTLFPMGKKEIRERLLLNSQLFEKTEHALTYSEDELEKFLDEEGIKKILSHRGDEKWKFLDYSIARDSHQRFLQRKKEKIEFLSSSVEIGEVTLWEKREAEKKISLLLFNPQGLKEITLHLDFDRKVSLENIKNTPKNLESQIGKNRISLFLKIGEERCSFFKSIYDFGRKTTFNISVVNCHEEDFKEIERYFLVRTVSHKKGEIILQNIESSLTLGDKFFNVEEISEDENSELVKVAGIEIPFRLKFQKNRNFPWDGNKVFRSLLESRKNFIMGSYPLQGEFQNFLTWEKLLLQEKVSDELNPQLKQSYEKIRNYYISKDLLPSLTFPDEELALLLEDFLEIYNTEIESLEENIPLIDKRDKLPLWEIGSLVKEETRYFSPLHPISMGYLLTLYNEVPREILSPAIYERLNFTSLVPLIIDKGESMRLQDVKTAPLWKVLTPSHESRLDKQSFLSRIAREKLTDFFLHFQYLFINKQSSLKVKIVNMENDYEIVRGIIDFILWEIEEKGLREITPLEIYRCGKFREKTWLEEIYSSENLQRLLGDFNLNCHMEEYDSGDILKTIKKSISYFQSEREMPYSHLTFYRMRDSGKTAKSSINSLPSAIGLAGLVSGISSHQGVSDYRTGLGIGDIDYKKSLLLRTTKNYNELICNMENSGKNSYQKNQILVTTSSLEEDGEIKKILQTSFWVNFIEPCVNLDYFYGKGEESSVIHYSDQYSSTTQYDSITVSSKGDQYRKLIKNYLETLPIIKNRDYDFEKISDSIIRHFNSFNGQWLLKMVGNRGNESFHREKISIISGVKKLLENLKTLLPERDIIWIPIALEEVLRVAGSAGLRREDGIFSAQNLSSRGRHSDDLLFMGIERGEKLNLHLYPVEVKIGNNESSIRKKAEEQIHKTSELFLQNLSKESQVSNFKNSFYRFFFIQILLSTVERFHINQVLLSKDEVDFVYSIREKLLEDEYEIEYSIKESLGRGGILLFQRDTPYEEREYLDYASEIMFFEYKESLAYKILMDI